MRKNRYDWTDELTDSVVENPARYTRATRRALGIRIAKVNPRPAPEYPRRVRRVARRMAEKMLRRQAKIGGE